MYCYNECYIGIVFCGDDCYGIKFVGVGGEVGSYKINVYKLG